MPSWLQLGTTATQISTGRQTKTGAGRFLRHSCAPAGGLLPLAQPLATAVRPPQRPENATVAFGKHHNETAAGRLRLKCVGTRAETRFRLSAKRTSPFKSVGALVQSTAGSRGVRISGSNARYTTFRDCVKNTGYPLHSPVSPSLPLPWVTVCHHISTGLYLPRWHCWSEQCRSNCADVCTSMSYKSFCRTKTWQAGRNQIVCFIKSKPRCVFIFCS